jgi:hypothetical protein
MLTLANLFILLLAAAAVWLGTAALVQKRTVQRRKDAPQRDDASA